MKKDKAAIPKPRAVRRGVQVEGGLQEMERKDVRLDPVTVTTLTTVGGGNLSLGVREAARRLVENEDAEPFSEERHAERLRLIELSKASNED